MLRILAGLAGVGIAASVAMGLDRARAERRADALWRTLEDGRTPDNGRSLAPDGVEGLRFDPVMVEDLPAPARRYLLRAIAPGTLLASYVRLELVGSIRLSREGQAMAMASEEILAPPRGFVWRARVGRGAMRMHGYDAYTEGEGEMRWWLLRLVPVVRETGPALARSAAGRMIGEAVLQPAALLPGRGARWEPVDETRARFVVDAGGEEVAVTIEVEPAGRLRRVSIRRWKSGPRNGPVGHLPFVMEDVVGERTFDGYTIPASFRAGWRLGEKGAFPFFFAQVRDAEYR